MIEFLSCFVYHRSASKGSGNSSSGHRSTSGSDITTGSGTSTNASSSEFSCDTVVYRGASGSGYSDGSGTDGEHPPMFYMRSAASSREGSMRGSLDEIPRPASAGSRRRKILTNGAISPRQCLSPSPRSPAGRAMSDCGGSKRNMLPAIPEVVAGDKMPLSGLVPIQSNHRYRQLCHINNLRQKQRSQKNDLIDIRNHRDGSAGSQRSEEVWIDCDPNQKKENSKSELNVNLRGSDVKSQQSSSKKRSSYGHMDSHKAQMINSWVENQSSPVNIGQGPPVFRIGSKESLENTHDLSKLPQQLNTTGNPDNSSNQPEFKVLTQFKTIDTSDDGGLSSVMSCENMDQVKVQIHQSQEPITTGGESPACMSYLESDSLNTINKTANKPIPPPPPPRRTSPQRFNLENHNEEVDGANEDEQIMSHRYTNDSKLEREEQLISSSNTTMKSNEEPATNECNMGKTRSRKPSAQNMLYSDQRKSYHEDELSENHPLRVLSESNLTVVSSFGGSLNNVNVEDETDNREEINANLSFFKLPDMPQENSDKICAFDDNLIDQRFKEFERLHNQGNNFNTNTEYSKSQDAIFSSPKPMLSTFGSKTNERNGQKIIELSEYTSLNETHDSNISNLYCEPFNPNIDNGNIQPHKSSFIENRLNFADRQLDDLQNLPSPNFRFNLPARSLQPDPDGSSNPEINLAGKDNRQSNHLIPINSNINSFGNSIWNKNECYDNHKISKSSSGNNNSSILVDNIRKSPNNNTAIGNDIDPTIQNNSIERREDVEFKESFGSRFLRLFGSKRKKNGKKRSKSCEANTEGSNKFKPSSDSSVAPSAINPKVKFLVDSDRHSRRSASASPDMLITAGRKLNTKNNNYPESLESKLTHDSGFYNFENKLDLNISSGNNSQNTSGSSDSKHPTNLIGYPDDERKIWENGVDLQDQIETNFNHIMIQNSTSNPHSIFYGGACNEKRPRSKHRKSSGYDSLEGDEESSSMDSSGSYQNKAQNIQNIQWDSKRENDQKVLQLNNLNDKNRAKNGTTKNSTGGVFKRFLSKNPSRSNSTNFTKASIAEEEPYQYEDKLMVKDTNEEISKLSFGNNLSKFGETSKAHITKPLNMEILQYDEMDILRMDFRSKQVSSSTASTTNNSHSSTYSSTHS